MNQKTFTKTAGIIFGLITVLHVLRLVYGWEAIIGSFVVPMWLSWVALFLAGSLTWTAYQLRRA